MGSWRGLQSLQLSVLESRDKIPLCSKGPYKGLKVKSPSVPPARGIFVLSREVAQGKLPQLWPCPSQPSTGQALVTADANTLLSYGHGNTNYVQAGLGWLMVRKVLESVQFLESVSSRPCTFFRYLGKLFLGMYTQSTLVGSAEICHEVSRLCIKAIVIHLPLAHQI